jgi:hypothetical protein
LESRRKQNTSRLASCVGAAHHADQLAVVGWAGTNARRILTMSVFVMP